MTEEELKQVMTHKFEDADLAFVRDIFVFICWTALAFVDVKNLTTDDIVDINGDKWIVSHRHKTNVPYQVKLMDVPLQIIERYKHLQEEKSVASTWNRPTNFHTDSASIIAGGCIPLSTDAMYLPIMSQHK